MPRKKERTGQAVLKRLSEHHEAQMAILNETTVHFSPEGFDDFLAELDRPLARSLTRKMRERLSRKAPWERD